MLLVVLLALLVFVVLAFRGFGFLAWLASATVSAALEVGSSSSGIGDVSIRDSRRIRWANGALGCQES